MKTKVEDKIIWSSQVLPGLVMTERMLALLRYRYSHVKSWKQMMLDLETYLVRRPEKTPKDFKKFVLNCAKRHSEDVQKGLRHPDGKVNLKAFANRAPERPVREDSFTRQTVAEDSKQLRQKLATLERGTPEYDETLSAIRRTEKTEPVLSFAEIMQRIAGSHTT